MADICTQPQSHCQPLDSPFTDMTLLGLLGPLDSQAHQMPVQQSFDSGFCGGGEQSGPESSATGSGQETSLTGQENTAEGANGQQEGLLATAASSELQLACNKPTRMNEDERRQRRRMSNRMSARKNRSKRIAQVAELQVSLEQYKQEKAGLQKQVEDLLHTIQQLQKQIQAHHAAAAEQRYLEPQMPANAAYMAVGQNHLSGHGGAMVPPVPHMLGSHPALAQTIPGVPTAIPGHAAALAAAHASVLTPGMVASPPMMVPGHSAAHGHLPMMPPHADQPSGLPAMHMAHARMAGMQMPTAMPTMAQQALAQHVQAAAAQQASSAHGLPATSNGPMPGPVSAAPDVPPANAAALGMLPVGHPAWKMALNGMPEHLAPAPSGSHGADASMQYMQSMPFARIPSPAMMSNGMMGMHPEAMAAGQGLPAGCYTHPIAGYQMM